MGYSRQIANKLDKLASEYIRRRYADRYGMVKCYTCGAKHHWKDMDNGHFIKRGHMQTRWELDNMRPQCRKCNRLLNGNYEVYTKRLTMELGKERIMEMWNLAYRGGKMSQLELELILEKYKKLLKSL